MKFLLLFITLITGFILGSTICPIKIKNSTPVSPDPTLNGLREVTGSKFSFAKVIEQTCRKKVLEVNSTHSPILEMLERAGAKVALEMSHPNSPARSKQRINEVSALFENALRLEIDAHPDFSCDFPKTQNGEVQRSGYPDLRITHLPTGTLAYLDPKLFEESSIKSSFRTFYYEPSTENSKVTEDGLHLLIGFPHDGKTREWTFRKPHLVDLSDLTVKLKAEFSASNRDLYSTSP